MRRFERELKATVMTAFERLEMELFDGATESNVTSVPARLDLADVVRPFRDAIVAGIQSVAIAGAEFGREQVERHVFGVKQIAGKQNGAPPQIDWQLANNEAAEWALQYGYDLVRGINNTTRTRLQREIARFVQNSETLPELRARLADLFGSARAEMIAVTEVTRSYAEGNRASWRESGVIEQREWRTANDELVCPICGPMAGTVVGLDEDFPGGGPPAHVRCRCWVVPVVTVD